MASLASPPAAERVTPYLANLSWLLPVAALFLVGLSDRAAASLAVPPELLILAAEIAAVLGAALGMTALLLIARAPLRGASLRRAAIGTGVSVAILVLTQLASLTGVLSARASEAELHAAVTRAVHDFPGWNGGVRVDGAEVFALEIDPRSGAGKLLLRGADRPGRLVLFGVDNVEGQIAIVLDVDGALALGSNGSTARGAASSTDVARARTTTVPPRARVEGVIAVFAPDVSFRDVTAVQVHVNGVALKIPGRYFTVEQKRAIDAARKAPGGQPGPR